MSKAKSSLPQSIVNALPTAAAIMVEMKKVEGLIPKLEKELAKAKAGGAIPLARAFVALRRMEDRIDEILKPLFGTPTTVNGEQKGTLGVLWRYKTIEVPAMFEQDGITNVPLAEGFRVGISSRFLASIKPNQKEAAYGWLKLNGLESLITPTVNSQTLSAALKKEMEEHNKQAPEDLFNVAMVPTTSVTATK